MTDTSRTSTTGTASLKATRETYSLSPPSSKKARTACAT